MAITKHIKNMKQKVKFGVVGFGRIGKRHAEIIDKHPHSELLAIVDIDDVCQAEATEKYPNIPFFKSIEEMLAADIKMDVINICTPNNLHANQSIQALEKKHHVVCEKPMGLSKEDCEKVIYKSLNMSKQLFCVMQNRYSPPAVWLKSLIDDNMLGDIYMVQLNCYWNRDERYYKKGGWKGVLEKDGGTLFTQFSHFVDIMYWLFGDIKNVHARFNNFNHPNSIEFEDSGIVNFEFINGGMGSINYSTSVFGQNMESSIAIIGEKGSVKVSGQYMDEVVHCNIDGYEMPKLAPSNPPNDYGEYKGSAANHHYVIQNVIDTLSGNSNITTNALEGLKVVEMIERIYSYRTLS